MKKVALFPVILALLVGCKGPELTINGKVDPSVQNVFIISGSDTLAIAPVTNGEFSVTVPVTETGFLNVREEGGQTYSIISEPGTVSYTVVAGQWPACGAELNDRFGEYIAKSQPLIEEYYQAAPEDRDSIEAILDKIDEGFLSENLSNWLGVYMISSMQYGMTAQELEDALNKLSPELSDNKDVIALRERVELLKKTAVGKQYINITLPSVDGTEISLADVVASNKYVLVDFWASWCGPCMGEVPYLVEDYAEYHSKGFEIFGVSLDKNKESWEKAIQTKNMSWIHVSDLQYWNCAPAKEYGVNSIPANFLIGSDGSIVALNLRGKELGEKLAELFGE